MHPLVRWQFRGGIEEKDRKAFLFTNVTDCQGPQVRHPGAGRRARGQPRDLPHRRQLPVRRDRRALGRGRAQPLPPRIVTNAPCHEIVITGKDLDKPGQGLDGIAAADLDAGLGRRALHHAVAIHHQGPRHRRAEHGQLPRPGEGAAAARHEPVAGAAAGHLQPLGKAARARLQETALRRRARRAAGRHLRLGAEIAGDARRVACRRRAGRRADQRGEGQDRRSAGAGRGRDRDRGLHRHRISGARGAVRRVATATSTCRSSTPSWTSPPSRGGRTPS